MTRKVCRPHAHLSDGHYRRKAVERVLKVVENINYMPVFNKFQTKIFAHREDMGGSSHPVLGPLVSDMRPKLRRRRQQREEQGDRLALYLEGDVKVERAGSEAISTLGILFIRA